MIKKLFIIAVITAATCPVRAQEIKFPKIDSHPLPADYSFLQNRLSTSSFRFNESDHNAFQMDFRDCDLTGYVLKDKPDLMFAGFNSKTKFPKELPTGFEPDRIMALGKNPGLGVRQLHARGVTGKGIGIGIIDQALLVEHGEYADRLRLYEQIHCPNCTVADMHAPAVASIATGKTTGVAPEADLYFISETDENISPEGTREMDLSYVAQSIDRLIEVNRQLPKERKIRVISISLSMFPKWKGHEKAIQAIQSARQNGIFVLTVDDKNFRVGGMGRLPLSNPEDKNSFSDGLIFGRNHEGSGDDSLQVPMDSRTLADPNGKDIYYFSRIGGASWTIPWMAGLYALACQIDSDMQPETFWAAALETAEPVSFQKGEKTYTLSKVTNPVKLITKLELERAKRQPKAP